MHHAYTEIAKAVPQLKIMLATYFGGLGANRDTALALPVAGLHLDLVRAPEQLDDLAGCRRTACCRSASSTAATSGAPISAGSSTGWNPSSPGSAADRVQLAPSCSLLHVPIDLALETGLDPDVKSWLAFSVQKIEELAALGTRAGAAAASTPGRA